jgi:signal transduction histidine kinase
MMSQKTWISETVLAFPGSTLLISPGCTPRQSGIPSVAQALYSISLFRDAIQMALEHDKIGAAKTNLGELIILSREMMAEMRLLIFQRRPPALEEVGLVPALKSRLDTVESKAGIQVVFHSEGERRLSAENEDQLYWIAQEALNNVIKHAHANQVKVGLIRQVLDRIGSWPGHERNH